MKKSLAIITVIYENYDVINDFLLSLKNQVNKNFHLFLIDLSKNKKELKLNIPASIIKSTNKGYAYGVNLGLKIALNAGFEFFCIINNDTFFNNNFINNVLLSIFNHPPSIIGGKIYYAPGFEYHKNKYKKSDFGKVIWYAGGKLDWKNVITPHVGVDLVDKGQYDKFEKTDFITGCLMIYDRIVIDKVGFWDESYFLYYEDADFCERAKRQRIKLFYDPSIVIYHKNAQSTEEAGSQIHQKFQQKNRLRFGLKYAPIRSKIHLLKNYFLGY